LGKSTAGKAYSLQEKNMSEIMITDRAIEEIKRVMAEQQFSLEEYVLEAALIGGGCSGFTHKLGFKEKSKVNPQKEWSATIGGIDVVVNHRAMMYLKGTTIDFHEGLNARGFLFQNENVRSTCGCGKSVSY
jgi:iron-sulfur cluster assembly accessory protein